MAKDEPRVTAASTSRELAAQISQYAPNPVRKVVHFATDDVDQYLANLRRFEEQSRTVDIVVK
jgi:hypothetical protein